MGYTTTFEGQITIDPPLNQQEIDYLTKFADTRRMACTQGPYYVDRGTDPDRHDLGVTDYNSPPAGQPGLWCQWVPAEDGAALQWDGGEKFYSSAEWMQYLIDHFIKPGALAKTALPFLQANHTANGSITAQGEEHGDLWTLVVSNNVALRFDR